MYDRRSPDAWGHINYRYRPMKTNNHSWRNHLFQPRLCLDCVPSFSLSLSISIFSYHTPTSLFLSLFLPYVSSPSALSPCSYTGNFKHARTTFIVIKEDRFCMTPDFNHQFWLIIRGKRREREREQEATRACKVHFTRIVAQHRVTVFRYMVAEEQNPIVSSETSNTLD